MTVWSLCDAHTVSTVITIGVSFDLARRAFGDTTLKLCLFVLVTMLGWFVPVVTAAPTEPPASETNIRLGKPLSQRCRVGLVVRSQGGDCRGLYATIPVPSSWPEQEVKVIDEETTPHVRSIRYRQTDAGVEQMLVSIPRLPNGQVARALVTYEITRYAILEPDDTSNFIVPKKLDLKIRRHLGVSPFIETRHGKIRSMANEIGENVDDAWGLVEALYDSVRDQVDLRNGKLKGAVSALKDGTGSHEDLTSLFIALCRASRIPARTVWVPGHCYPEFYLMDEDGNGYWIPCQIAGLRSFGSMPGQQPILQKGDNFKIPESKKRLRFVPEFLTGKSGGGKPRVTFVQDVLPAE